MALRVVERREQVDVRDDGARVEVVSHRPIDLDAEVE
jgi:hypothetical protein